MPETVHTALPISAAGLGQRLRIVRVSVPGDDAARLQAMGICVGRPLELVQEGDPLIVRVLGSRVGLSARLARHVLVEPIHMPPSP